MHQHFMGMARRLELLGPVDPEDIFKTQLKADLTFLFDIGGTIDINKQHLAKTIVSAFINAGFGSDTMIVTTGSAGSRQWIHRHKRRQLLSGVSGVGLVNLWDVDSALNEVTATKYSRMSSSKLEPSWHWAFHPQTSPMKQIRSRPLLGKC